MGWTKADKEAFLKTCDEHRGAIMPQEVISKQKNLFEDIIETDVPNPRYQKIRLALKYPALAENPDGDPMAKQSARFTVSRYSNGIKKGEPIIFQNKRTGKDDVMIKSYQDAKITNTAKMLQLQLLVQLKAQPFTKFRSSIFVTRMEFIFKVSKNAPQYMMNDLKTGTKIYFKDTKPDLDNLEKMVWDAMQAEKAEKDVMNAMTGLVYDNDAQIVSKNGVFKRWGIVPGLILELEGYI
jgi:Holliday junction resolvase RusA-like endonuclease